MKFQELYERVMNNKYKEIYKLEDELSNITDKGKKREIQKRIFNLRNPDYEYSELLNKFYDALAFNNLEEFKELLRSTEYNKIIKSIGYNAMVLCANKETSIDFIKELYIADKSKELSTSIIYLYRYIMEFERNTSRVI